MADIFVAKQDKKMEEKKKRKSHSALSAYSYCPSKVNFVATDSEEKIILLLRRHPITNVPWILLASIMSLAPFLFVLFPPFGMLPEGYQLVVVMSWYMLNLAFVLEQFLSWYFNVCIITDERIFDVDFVNLIYREITDANIDQIQEPTVRVGGVVRTLFDYGDILIQTAADSPQIEFGAVPHPDRVAKILRKLRVEEEVEKIEGRVR